MDKILFYWTDPTVTIHSSAIKAFGFDNAAFISFFVERWRDIYWNEREILIDGEYFNISRKFIKKILGFSLKKQQRLLQYAVKLGIIEIKKYKGSYLFKVNAKNLIEASHKERFKRALVK